MTSTPDQPNPEFLPGFRVPLEFSTDRILLKPLTTEHLDLDYEAVKTSTEHLQGVFGPHDHWPDPQISREQDLRDLEFHQREFETRGSFTYTVLSLDEQRCLGCVYIIPSKNPQYEAVAIMWVREDEVVSGLDQHLFESVKNWLAAAWPLKSVAYPGRETDWSEFPEKVWANL